MFYFQQKQNTKTFQKTGWTPKYAKKKQAIEQDLPAPEIMGIITQKF